MSMTINSMANTKLMDDYRKISTGKKINSASDDASGLAIAEKLAAEINGLGKGTENTYNMDNLLKTADGGLSVVGDGLQRVRELSLQATNGTLADSDKEIIGNEIQQIMQGISSTVSSTEFNNQKLLDGSFTNKNTASSADGTGKSVSIGDMSLESLGLKDFGVSGNFDISALDDAISMVSSTRSNIGAISNAFNHTINSNGIAELNLAAAKSSITDTDMAKTITEASKNRLLNEYQMFAQTNQMENMTQQVAMISEK